MPPEPTPQELERLLLPLLGLCRAAGEAIGHHYHAPGADDYRAKGDDSPLTQADLVSDHLLQAGLAALEPTLPVLSEESAETVRRARRGWERYWLIDPLDGTKEFLARTGEFTINLALIDRHRPVLGVLYLPLEHVAYTGIPGRGARRYALTANGDWHARPLATRRLADGAPLVVLASRRHRSRKLRACLAWLGERRRDIERRDSGSALKFCRLAEGEGDFYPRFSPCCEWDTAAGQALLEAAGGSLLGLDGAPLRYNTRDSLYSPHFYAIADPAHPLWRSLLEEFDPAAGAPGEPGGRSHET